MTFPTETEKKPQNPIVNTVIATQLFYREYPVTIRRQNRHFAV